MDPRLPFEMNKFESYDNPSSISTVFDQLPHAGPDHHTNYDLLSPTDSQTSTEGASPDILDRPEISTQPDINQPLEISCDTFLGSVLNHFFHERKTAVEFARETARKFGFNILVRTSRPNYAVLVCACRTRKQSNLKSYQAASVYAVNNGSDRPKRVLGRKPKRQETGCKFHVILRRETAEFPWQFRQSRETDHNHPLPVGNTMSQTQSSSSLSIDTPPRVSLLSSRRYHMKSLNRQEHQNTLNVCQDFVTNPNNENLRRSTVNYAPVESSFEVQTWNPMELVHKAPLALSHLPPDTSSSNHLPFWRVASLQQQSFPRQVLPFRSPAENIHNMGIITSSPANDDPAHAYFDTSITPYCPNDILFSRGYMEGSTHPLGFADTNLTYVTSSELTYPITTYQFQ